MGSKWWNVCVGEGVCDRKRKGEGRDARRGGRG